MNKYLYILLISVISISGFAQKQSKEEYISKYYQLAIQEMNLYKIPASITLAQGLLETESGNSKLCSIGKNHFGIKCKATWTGMKFIKDDDTKDECFRAYTTNEESYRDHSIFLQNVRYARLFTYELTDYKSWAYGLKECGYATNPKYPQILIKFIEDLKLNQYDNYGLTNTADQLDRPFVEKKSPVVWRLSDTNQILKVSQPDDQRIIQRKERANQLNLTIIDEKFDVMKLSKLYEIDLGQLLRFNDLTGEQSINSGQNFFLQEKKESNPANQHIVQAGQSLYDISQMYGVKISSLRSINKIEDWAQPMTGEVLSLNIPKQFPVKQRPFYEVDREKNQIDEAVSSTSIENLDNAINYLPKKVIDTVKTIDTAKREKQWIQHTVATKETLFKIAKTYQVKPNEILEWNGLTMEKGLSAGQSIKIFTQVLPIAMPKTTLATKQDTLKPTSIYIKKSDSTLKSNKYIIKKSDTIAPKIAIYIQKADSVAKPKPIVLTPVSKPTIQPKVSVKTLEKDVTPPPTKIKVIEPIIIYKKVEPTKDTIKMGTGNMNQLYKPKMK